MKKIISAILAVLMVMGSTVIFTSCGDDYTAQDLQDAKGRYFSGKASKSDKRMVEGFYKWKANQ